ncbi:hypothetical protein ACQKPC_09550 [Pseudomonas sp. NPDC089918]|uniref:hypothetical protein n=1 Tax=Pseudomonas sp. NPDC089918 TaxID=3390654 RepID=UPI003D067B5A
MGSIRFFQNFICALAGLTIAYWACVLVGANQNSGLIATLMAAIVFWLISSRIQKNQEIRYSKDFFVLLGVSIFFASITAFLYAFNPDDSTFFHRIAFLRLSGDIFLPNYDTRIAFDQVAPISAAHLMTSWEYFLSNFGSFFGSEIIGYQIGGTFVSIMLYAFSVNYAVAHFFPKTSASTRVIVAGSVFLFLFFGDADQNRRIGAWLFLGGWTGKCFLSAALITLFPAFDRAYETNRPDDWFFVFCTVVFFLGLTGSSLFILPLAIAALILTELIVRKGASPRFMSFLLAAVPVTVGGIFIYKFGGLKDDSYWRGFETMPFSDYIKLSLSSRSLFIYLALIPILLYKNLEINRAALIKFSVYQLVLGIVLLNPLLLPVFHKFVPSDGFWRIYYLFQYPTIVAMLGMIVINFIKIQSYNIALLPSLFLVLIIAAGSNIFSLQKQWGYPHHFKGLFEEKLPEIELMSVRKASENCRHFKESATLLAPEQWEVTAQMLEPSLRSVAARHMHHNFLNTNTAQIKVPEDVRLRARNFATGLQDGSAEDFRFLIAKGVDIIVIRSQVENGASLMLNNYKKVLTEGDYVVFCRN